MKPEGAAQNLPLQGTRGRAVFWIAAIMAIPFAIVAITFVTTHARTPTGSAAWIGSIASFAIVAAAFIWIVSAIRRASVSLDSEALTIVSGIGTRRYPIAALRAGGLRIADLANDVQYRPVIRTFGIGLPGFMSGWFRLHNGSKALCIVTAKTSVTVLRSDDGTWIVLSLADPAPLRDALAAA